MNLKFLDRISRHHVTIVPVLPIKIKAIRAKFEQHSFINRDRHESNLVVIFQKSPAREGSLITHQSKEMSPSRGKYKQFSRRRCACLAWLFTLLNDFLSSADAFVLQARSRVADRRHLPTSPSFVLQNGKRFEASPIFHESAIPSTSLMSTTNDNTNSMGGYSGYANNTDTSGSASFPADQHKQQKRHEGGTLVDADLETLDSRLGAMRAETIWQAQVNGPPNANLGPVDFVSAVLSALRDPDDPLPDAGFRALLRSSSKKWRESIRRSVGAPVSATEDVIARALCRAMGRSDSPFGLLVSAAGAEDCEISFPNDVLDFEDGTAWLQCIFHRCRGMDYTPLLATKWSLVQREMDGAWLIDDIEFNDLRNEGGGQCGTFDLF